ncbi:uncharacterized protein METZ01_LOCUS123695 [marine metagenome]|uniref:Uncharacterized protein n=1 Tax=marine metagenome TaxID=408172 RepID=A0A381Y2E8_9ZZZZ
MNTAFFPVIAAVVVAVDVGGHTGILGQQVCHYAMIPEVMDIVRIYREMAEENNAFLLLRCGFQY